MRHRVSSKQPTHVQDDVSSLNEVDEEQYSATSDNDNPRQSYLFHHYKLEICCLLILGLTSVITWRFVVVPVISTEKSKYLGSSERMQVHMGMKTRSIQVHVWRDGRIARRNVEERCQDDEESTIFVRARLLWPSLVEIPLVFDRREKDVITYTGKLADVDAFLPAKNKEESFLHSFHMDVNLMPCVYFAAEMDREEDRGDNCLRSREYRKRFRINSEWQFTPSDTQTGKSNATVWGWSYYPPCERDLKFLKRSQNCTTSSGKDLGSLKLSEFVWMEINRQTGMPRFEDGLIQLATSAANGQPAIVSKLESLRDGGPLLKSFGELSNYELVCWIGDDDAASIRSAFLALYPQLNAPFQRPFKFKYLKITDINNPTRWWGQDGTDHETLRKCKIVFVSYGQYQLRGGTTLTSPSQYRDEVIALLLHLSRAIEDDTFPIWMLSVRSSSCQSTISKSKLRLEQPDWRFPLYTTVLNRELQELFLRDSNENYNKKKLPDRIRFMDNTDVTEPLWDYPGIDDVSTLDQAVAVIAMRCIEIVALQVDQWRAMGQIGTKTGLRRNGSLIPNKAFVKYNWDSLKSS